MPEKKKDALHTKEQRAMITCHFNLLSSTTFKGIIANKKTETMMVHKVSLT